MSSPGTPSKWNEAGKKLVVFMLEYECGFRSEAARAEWRARSFRNGGRDHLGMVGDFIPESCLKDWLL